MKNLKLITKKDGSLTVKHNEAIREIIYSNGRVYTDRWIRSGRRFNLQSNFAYVMDVAKSFGFKVTTGNDAPKGGAEGNFVKFSSRAIKSIANYYENAK